VSIAVTFFVTGRAMLGIVAAGANPAAKAGKEENSRYAIEAGVRKLAERAM
jgi:hypothetical protein